MSAGAWISTSPRKKSRGTQIRIGALTTRQTTNKRGIDARPTLKQADYVMLTTALPFRSDGALFLL